MAEMLLTKYHDVIEAVLPDRSDQPLRESILPGRSSRNRAIPYAHRCEAPNESLTIGAGRVDVCSIPSELAWRPGDVALFPPEICSKRDRSLNL
jgi:hypothetical protein